jgi:hypothetical protein
MTSLRLLLFSGSLLLVSAGGVRGQLMPGGAAVVAEVGLVTEVAVSQAAECNPCTALFPATRLGFVSPRWTLGVVVVGPVAGDAPGQPEGIAPTVIALEARHRLRSITVGGRVLHTVWPDSPAGGTTAAALLVGARATPALTLEAGAGPLVYDSADGRAIGWNVLAGLRLDASPWSAWVELQGVEAQAGLGGAALGYLSYRTRLPTLFVGVQAYAQPGGTETATGPGTPPGGPPFFGDAQSAVGSGPVHGSVQTTLGMELPLIGSLRLLTEAGARTDAGGARGVFRAGVRLMLGPWSTGARPASRWRIRPAGAELALRFDGSSRLYLVGDFNDWAEPGLPLRPDGAIHRLSLDLPSGSYAYKIVAEDAHGRRWLAIPPELASEPDGFGDVNGILIITE